MRLSRLFEAVVQDDETAATVLQILDDVSGKTSELREFIRLANERLESHRVRFTSNLTGIVRADHEWITLPVAGSIRQTIDQAKMAMQHEFVHREQFKAIDRDKSGNAKSLNSKWEKSFDLQGGNADNIDHKKYYNLPQEVMAYAKMDANEWVKTHSPKQMPKKPSYELPYLSNLYHYLTLENRKRYMSYFAAYLAKVNKA